MAGSQEVGVSSGCSVSVLSDRCPRIALPVLGPPCFQRPLSEPCVRFSLTRLSIGSSPPHDTASALPASPSPASALPPGCAAIPDTHSTSAVSGLGRSVGSAPASAPAARSRTRPVSRIPARSGRGGSNGTTRPDTRPGADTPPARLPESLRGDRSARAPVPETADRLSGSAIAARPDSLSGSRPRSPADGEIPGSRTRLPDRSPPASRSGAASVPLASSARGSTPAPAPPVRRCRTGSRSRPRSGSTAR